MKTHSIRFYSFLFVFSCVLFLGSSTIIAQYPDAEKHHTSEFPDDIEYLFSISQDAQMASQQLDVINTIMLRVTNKARLNPNYRQDYCHNNSVFIPQTQLYNLVLDSRLIELAQEQADYQASNNVISHSNNNYGNFKCHGKECEANSDERFKRYPEMRCLEVCAKVQDLRNIPIGWMCGNTHYRPTWDLDGDPVTAVGFGVAQGSDGWWYATAVYAKIGQTKKPAWNEGAQNKMDLAIDKYSLNRKHPIYTGDLPLPPGSQMEPGRKYHNPDGTHFLVFQKDGNLVIYNKDGGFLWGSQQAWGVNSKDIKKAVMTTDGKFQLTDDRYNSLAGGSPSGTGNMLSVSKDGDLVYVNNANKTEEIGYTGELPMPAGSEFKSGKKYYNADRSHYILLQPEGNLVIYRSNGDHVWNAKEAFGLNEMFFRAALTESGQLTCMAKSGFSYVNVGSQGMGHILNVESDGSLVIKNANGEEVFKN